MAGTIKSLNVAEGDFVRQGQAVGSVDDGSLRNAYNIAAATLEQARDAYDRMKLLHDSNSLPDIKWVEVQSKLSQAESAEKIARIALDDARLYAPVSGVVAEKMASVGQSVAPGMPVISIMDIRAVKIAISVPENEVRDFDTGSTASIFVKAAEGASFTGTMVEKGIVANPLSRSYMIKYRVDNSAGTLLPGMICDVEVSGRQDTGGIVIPAPSVMLAADNSLFVWTDTGGAARKQPVTAGAMLPEGVVIESGLKPGDKVIVEGMAKVSQGTPVISID